MQDWTIWTGDALATLAQLESESVHCVCTSPPYWRLRDLPSSSGKLATVEGYRRNGPRSGACVGFLDELSPGERLICLQNDPDLGVYNGMLATVTEIHGTSNDLIVAALQDEMGEEFPRMPILRRQLGKEKKEEWVPRGIGQFDYGYCITCHKSQGSSWPRVAVLDQVAPIWTPERWRYTAATRASQELHYFLSERSP